MKRLIIIAACAALAVVRFAPAANAGNATSTFTVSANVSNNCTIAAANLAFGAYDPIVANTTTPLNVNSTVTVACTKGAVATVGLNAGSNGGKGGCATTRAMSTGGATPAYLCYEIYSNSGLSTVWGNSGAGLINYTSAGKAPVGLIDYGQVPAGQDVATGSYSDSVIATINF